MAKIAIEVQQRIADALERIADGLESRRLDTELADMAAGLLCRWVPVTERLPADHVTVFAWVPDHYRVHGYRWRGRWLNVFDESLMPEDRQPTHWLDGVPEPPCN